MDPFQKILNGATGNVDISKVNLKNPFDASSVQMIESVSSGSAPRAHSIAYLTGANTEVSELLDGNNTQPDAIATDGSTISNTTVDNVNITATDMKLEKFKKLLRAGNKFVLTGIKQNVTLESQINNALYIRRSEFPESSKPLIINFRAKKDQTNNNTKQVDVDLTELLKDADKAKYLIFDQNTEIFQKLNAGEDQTLQLFLQKI